MGFNPGCLLKSFLFYLSLQAKLHVGGLAATNSLKVECFFSKLDEIPGKIKKKIFCLNIFPHLSREICFLTK